MSNLDVRFSSFNASLNRSNQGDLIQYLSTYDNNQAKAVAEIIQRANPDVLLINEFDFDENGEAAKLFQDNYLSVSQNGATAIDFPYVYLAPSNTGIPSGFDLDNNGEVGGGNDAFGFGFFPGQFGMVLFSKHPIDTENIRTFQNFLWKDMPDALLPVDPVTGESWYSEEELAVFRLSSKSHWDIPININGETVHVLASHPTPPVFDGLEDRNGTRNHDEIRFWSDYITPGAGDYIYDDQGNFGGLLASDRFVIMGDQNADPFDGDSTDNAILQILDNPLVNTSVTPSSEGGVDASNRQGLNNLTHGGNPAFDTADFGEENFGGPGNLRVDYVLPSQNLTITDATVFWPKSDDPAFELVGDFPFPSSDHRLVYVDVEVEPTVVDTNSKVVTGINFLGEVSFNTRLQFENTEVGGISGLAYDPANGVYYGLSDDRSQNAPARFYTIDIDLSDGSLDNGDVGFTDVTTLRNASGEPFPERGVDPEGIALTSAGTLFISSEGDANNLLNPFVNEFSLAGQEFNQLTVPDKFLPTSDGTRGIRNNRAFESLTISPDERFLYTAVENALIQDGPASTLEDESPVRILQYDLQTGEPAKEFLYITDTIPNQPDPPGSFADNGLVELLALDNTGTLLALERSFAVGVGNNLRLYEVRLQDATDISDVDNLLSNPTDPDSGLLEVEQVAEKRLLLDFDDLGIRLDNSEAIAFGPTLPDGRQSLIVASDNNFNDSQITQFLAFGLDLDHIQSPTAIVEATSEINGTQGADQLIGTIDADLINGFGGNDTIAGALGNDILFGGNGDDILRGDNNSRSPDGKAGGDDIIYGGSGSDRIGGKFGNDSLYGGFGDDQLWGDAGDDLLSGGLGNDTLTGDNFSNGSGSDTFVLEIGEGTDTITDFELGTDFIGLGNGLSFGEVSITSDSNNSLINVGDETLAVVLGVTTLAERDFVIL
ncbi:esterase-like activity of phytase family protein [Moorena sp. SIO3B2]|uniref:esterase-like activity of phytase family protein n=1 Tax=Moorena sp. SIO3B2 TaxID=2607827 RepID=UPI0013C69222|nr:esterase-like activity of phytase family protein [Moorena sp. SIO3B2]NEP30077.1 endonuclease/exonuclease/phosphatase [Moorena sp. SIO3B2]